MIFELHPQLIEETDLLGHFPLCLALLHKDNAAPWMVLVPKRDGLKEFHHLPSEDLQQFLREAQAVCNALEHLFVPDKINIGSLGNMVPQVHIHIIARYKGDIAWPKPMWGNTRGELRTDKEHQGILSLIHI